MAQEDPGISQALLRPRIIAKLEVKLFVQNVYCSAHWQQWNHTIAIPFAFSKEEAIRQMMIPAARLGAYQNLPRALLSTHLPWLGINPPRPKRIEAMYLPTWVVDAEIRGKAWVNLQGHGGQKLVYILVLSSKPWVDDHIVHSDRHLDICVRHLFSVSYALN